MASRYRYSEWDGTQDVPSLDADEVLAGLTDDLMNFGDLQHALRNMLQRGMRMSGDQRMHGMRDLLQQLRQQRRQQLDRFDLSSVFDSIQQALDEIIDLERDTLDDRMDEAGGAPNDSADGPRGKQPQGQRGGREGGSDGEDASEGMSGQQEARGQGGGGQQQAQRDRSSRRTPLQGGSQGQPSGARMSGGQESGRSGQDGDGEGAGPDEQSEFTEMLRNIVERKQDFLDGLSQGGPGRMKQLQEYEFMNPEAHQKFQELLDSLKQQMMNSFFQDMSQALQHMSEEDMDRARQMVQDLNEMLRQRMDGQEPNFDKFMEKYGDLFGDNPPQSPDELVEQMQSQAAMMQSLLDSLPSEMRDQLQQMVIDRMSDTGMQQELQELAANLESLYPMRDLRNQYPFRGQEELDLQAAMNLMGEMQDMDEVERQLERTQYGGALDDIDADKLEALLGEEAWETLDQLRNLLEILENAGYIRRKGKAWELTPRGNRKIGQRALAEIYANLKRQNFGKHKVAEIGRSGERTDDTKTYEFGDPFQLDLKQTMMNAMYRTGPTVPVALRRDDFEIYRSETLTQTATVLMLDLSWSMALRGSFQAAKKVALALNNLIRMQYPRDSLYLVGFSAYARELSTEELPFVRWDETVLGTNMHHALIIAQRLLSKHKIGTKQIIMVTDGEPTAHLENGRSYFAYPPSPVTIRETLREVKHCTQKGIVINTFMLDRNSYLKEFMAQVAKINRGRVFYSTPDQLGEYVLVDFVSHKRTNLRGAS